ncbi:Thioredoxin-disulfide reductase [Bertholletia excelsa]
MDRLTSLASENWVVIFCKSTCCLCSALNILFQKIGVNLGVYEINHDSEGRETENALVRLVGLQFTCPTMFIGGKLVGSTNKIMSFHLSGFLIPLLKPCHQSSPA